MRILHLINFVLLALLGFATGMVKIFGMKAEMDLFSGAGWPVWLIVAFGVLQSISALLLIPLAMRKIAAFVLMVSFIAATSVLFIAHQFSFGFVSVLFILMAAWILLKPALQWH